ncbi:N-terminal phage integrase SAM-like domain-containing protein [Alkalicoccobacillus plakortidis]|uniref:N-terminal phage integrase SAM-like domain-containing protein n=1 Tax=Alkalicoccobacillus plakortidis TaxID=444060 RepID=A0ABT0XI04_9BACI|nr:N-terminal phage integrase SAM-like domain-containing protein [Alkalicoccobacillus plakortidis]MCM2675514.1 N-terminal phage integrase SAM-like domain-containing protein [Alkalicoccobacillus plakortidis]
MATFRKLKSGRWQARVSKEGKEFSIGTFKQKKEAEIEAGRVEERIFYGHTIKDKNILFEELALDWLNNHKKTELESSTYEQYEMAIRLHILPEFGRRKAMLIKRTDIKKWVNQYSEIKKPNGDLKYSYGTRIRYLSVLKSIFHYAVHEIELLEKSPSHQIISS